MVRSWVSKEGGKGDINPYTQRLALQLPLVKSFLPPLLLLPPLMVMMVVLLLLLLLLVLVLVLVLLRVGEGQSLHLPEG